MHSPLDIRWNHPAERDAILAFIAAMGFTPRDATTWEGLAMRAVCAWRGERLVGVLPIEPRPLKISAGVTVPAAHLTCVAVHPDERGTGVGSAMQRHLADDPPDGARLFTVFREDADSPGYRWYLKNGFSPAIHILSWSITIESASISTDRPAGRGVPNSSDAWLRVHMHGGVVDQRERALNRWLAVHPYRNRYAFDVIPLGDRGYAVIGIGTLHSDSPRLDVLDLIAADPESARAILEACFAHARDRGIGTIRLALAENDPHARVAAALGMTAGWNFDLLIRRIDPSLTLDPAGWRYASIDFA